MSQEYEQQKILQVDLEKEMKKELHRLCDERYRRPRAA